MKKMLSKILTAIRVLTAPKNFMESTLSKPTSYFLICMISAQLFFSVCFTAMISFSDNVLKDSEEMVFNIFYGLIIIYPLFIALFSLALHWGGTTLGGEGRFGQHFKALMIAFTLFIVSIVIVGFVTTMLSILFQSDVIYKVGFYLQPGILLYYSICATIVVHKFTTMRSLSSHILVISVTFFMQYLGQIIMKQ